MSKIPLRVYNQEIEEAIEQKQIEEAIAHCQHILKSYPKHIDTYRLLGKAYLESQRYGNAADLFQRVLSSIPTDFISHIGMSIIREDEGNLDASIWHMERAFETQPYNTAIQAELRRLYGQRDGFEPPKIRMTRGALARMYAKGDLYDQAISEIRAFLASDSERPDLLVLLAEIYAKNGQESEAIETCGTILKKLPFCLDANFLLMQLIPEGVSGSEVRTCMQRIQALDPYNAFLSPQHPTSRDVPDQAVTITKLDWDGGPVIPDSSRGPEWASTIGVDIDASETDDLSLPDWLVDDEGVIIRSVEQPPVEVDSGDIPDWLQEAGWEPSDGTGDQGPVGEISPEMETEIEEAVAGDLPSWLQSIAPEGILDEDHEGLLEIDDVLPEWLTEEADGSADSIVTWLDGQEPAQEPSTTKASLEDPNIVDKPISEEDIPDWLQEISEDEIEAEPVHEILSEEEPAVAADIPDWLQEISEDEIEAEPIQETPSEEEPAVAADIPDWLQEISEDEIVIEAEPVQEILSVEEKAVAAEIPDWLQEISEDEIEIEAEPVQEILSEEEPAVIAEIPDWLQEISGDEIEIEAVQETPSEEEPAVAAEIPDWLQEISEDKIEAEPEPIQETPSEEEPAVIAEIPDWIQEISEDEIEIEAEPVQEFPSEEEPAVAAEIPDWLQEISEDKIEAEPEPIQETPSEEEPAVIAEIPDWIQEISEDEIEIEAEPVQEFPSEEEKAVAAEIPDWLQEISEDEIEIEAEPVQEILSVEEKAVAAEIPDWLQEISEDEIEIEAEPVQEILSEEEPAVIAEIPDWLQEISGDEIEIEAVQETPSEEEPAVAAEIPDWLQEISEDKIEAEPEPIQETPSEEEPAVIAEIPDWIQEISEDEIEIEAEPVQEFPSEEEPAVAAEIPDWLQEISEDEIEAEPVYEILSEEEPAAAAEIPDWIQEISEDEIEAEPEPIQETPSEEEPAVIAEIPDWLQEISGDEIEIEAEPAQEILPEKELTAAVEIPDFLQDFNGDKVEPDTEAEPKVPVDVPDWLLDIEEESQEETESRDQLAIEPETIEEKELSDEDLVVPEWVDAMLDNSKLDIFPSGVTGWLDDLDEEEIAKTKIIYDTGELPKWLEDLDKEAPDVKPEPEPLPPPSASEIDESFKSEFADAEEAMEWIENLAAKQVISEEELISQPSESTDSKEIIQDRVSGFDTAVEQGIEQVSEIEPEPPSEDELELEAEVEQKVAIEDPEALFGELIPSEEGAIAIDQEATMSWLESLPEIEEEPQDDQVVVQTDTQPVLSGEFEGTTSDIDVEVEPETGMEPEISEVDSGIAWLESIAAASGVPEEELISHPEQRSDLPPEWVQEEIRAAQIEDTQPDKEVKTPEVSGEETEDEYLEEIIKQELAKDLETSGETIPSIEDQAVEILPSDVGRRDQIIDESDSVLLPDYEDFLGEITLEDGIDTQITEKEYDSAELVESSQRQQDTMPPDEDYEWLPIDIQTLEQPPDLLELNEASLIQLERLLSLGFRAAQAIVVYRQEHGPFNSLGELHDVPGLDELTINALAAEVKVTSPEPELDTEVAGRAITDTTPTDFQPKVKTEALEHLGTEALTDGDFKVAFEEFTSLIEKGERLNDVIEELNNVLFEDYSNEICVEIFQMLGDAYVKAGRLQEALDTYSKAEDLLR